MATEPYVFDLNRILFGDMPWLYVAEIVFRTSVMYLYALVVVRMLGKRGMGQLAPFDFVIIIALGSAVGDPMFYHDVPLFHALVAITGIVLFTRGLVHLTQRSPRIDAFLSSSSTRLVKDGVMELENMAAEGISRDELFQALRTEGIEQLGQVERAYLEPSGRVTAFRHPAGEAMPGVPLLPEADIDESEFHEAGDLLPRLDRYGCWTCGMVLLPSDPHLPKCPHCGCTRWTRAVARAREIPLPRASGGDGDRPGESLA